MAPQPHLAAAWQTRFPTRDFLTTTLLEIVIHADLHRRQTEAAFTALKSDLEATQLPMHYWDRLTHKVFHQIHHYAVKAQRHFFHALTTLQTTFKAPAPDPEPKPAPQPMPTRKATLQQVAYFQYDDIGNLTATTAVPNAYSMLSIIESDPNVGSVERQFDFPNGTVPEPYQSVLAHNGETLPTPPAPMLTIGYPVEVFKELCTREITTKVPHLIDAPDLRTIYRWWGDWGQFPNQDSSPKENQ